MKADAVERHERVRADWLLHHKGSGFALSDQRMSNQLRKKAAEKDRTAVGAAESAHHEAQIKSFVSRWIAGGEDQTDRGGRSFWTIVLAAPVALALGPMLAVSKGLYTLSTEVVLRQMKNNVQRIPKAIPWLLAALAVALVAGIATPMLPVKVIQPWPWKVSFEPMNFLIVYALWQLAFGTLLTAWQVRRHGWPGVKVKSLGDTSGLLPTDVEPGYVSAVEDTGTVKASVAPTDTAQGAAPDQVEIEGFDEEFEDWMAEVDFEDDKNDEGEKSNV